MNSYFDLHIKTPLYNKEKTKQLIEKAEALGYKGIGISFPTKISKIEEKNITELRKLSNIEIIARADFSPKTSKELLLKLKRNRRKYEVIAINCLSKNVARQAAKDHRVDLISFSSLYSRKRFFDISEAKLASKTPIALEIDLAPLLYLDTIRRYRLISFLRKETFLANKYKVTIIFSSGATEPFLLRKPLDMASLSYLFDMDFRKAKESISIHPQRIINKNREKLSAKFISTGVFEIGRKKMF